MATEQNTLPVAGRTVSALSTLLMWAAVAGCAPQSGPPEVVVYSSRNEPLIKPIFERFTVQTGVPVRFVTGEAAPLRQRLKTEGQHTPADLLLTVDAGELWRAAEEGLLQPVERDGLKNAIPEHLRDPRNRWFGLSVRARTIVYSTARVQPEALSTYAALGEPQWKGRLCLRTSKKVYNQSLVAMFIAESGEPRAEEIVRGWVNNLAAEPFANDTLLMQAIVAGQCDVGIVNTYYFARLLKDTPAAPLALFWADQANSGVHVNISGAGIVRWAPHPQAAVQLLEWLASPEAQKEFAGLNFEYPANPAVPADPLVQGWGTFRQNPINVSRAGELQAAAVRLMDRAGYR